MRKWLFILLLSFPAFILSCKKEGFILSADALLYITKDSIKFDTVFTSVGSITQSFKIINTNNQKLLLSSIKLMGGGSSAFKININGVSVSELNDIEIESNDSIYVFVSLYLNPNNTNLPILINDSIQIKYNNNERYVQLEAYGQNAHFLNNTIIERDTTLINDLPYVILGSLIVKNNATLTLDEGCRLFMHANAPLLVEGTLIANGTKNNEVIFCGDRLDEYYKDLPASWPGIYFKPSSKNNVLTYAILKNATDAIVADSNSLNTNPKLVLHQCKIDNALQSGIFAKQSSIDADNCLISNCGKNINIEQGGNYHFNNCTVVSYSNFYIIHNSPVLQVNNYAYPNGLLTTGDIYADFKNCIFWGDGGGFDEEINLSKEGANPYNVSFRNCLIKSNINNSDVLFTDIIRNIDPSFDSVDTYNNYYLFTSNRFASPLIDSGLDTTTAVSPFDLNHNNRIAGLKTDIGCYEKQN
jgi:hypothetical protein